MGRLMVIGATALLLLMAGCKPGPGAGPVKIWADPALRAPLNQLVKDFKKHHPSGWQITYKEAFDIQRVPDTDRPDVVLTTEPVAQQMLKAKWLDETSMRTFAGDLLTLVTPRDKPLDVAKVGDLPMMRFKALAIGNDHTSVGYYTQQALISDGAAKKVEELEQPFNSTDELLAAMKGGAAQVGIVYASAAAQSPELKVTGTVPEDLYEDIKYSAVASKDTATRHGVMELLKFLSEDPATQKVLGSYGFLDRTTALEETK